MKAIAEEVTLPEILPVDELKLKEEGSGGSIEKLHHVQYRAGWKEMLLLFEGITRDVIP